MNKPNFTPGPWTVGDKKAGFMDKYDIHPAIGFAYGAMNYKEAKANATLIAAAPDLYAALELLVNQTRDGMGHEYDDGEWPALDKARAALAKARGEHENS